MSDSHENTTSQGAGSLPNDISRKRQSNAGSQSKADAQSDQIAMMMDKEFVSDLVLHYCLCRLYVLTARSRGGFEKNRSWMQKHASSSMLSRDYRTLGDLTISGNGRDAHSVGSLLWVEACYVPLVVTAQNKIYLLWESVGSMQPADVCQ